MSTIFIRADGSTETGYGHLMRCSVLANHLQEAGHKVIWITKNPRKLPWGFLGKGPFKVFDAEEGKDESALSVILKAGGKKDDWIIIDSYKITINDELKLRSNGFKVLTIDDNCNRIFDCDILLNPNPHAKELKYKIDSKTIYLLGNEYILFREDIISNTPVDKRSPPRQGLVVFGGTDRAKQTERIIKIIFNTDFYWNVILPADYSNYKPDSQYINYIQGPVDLKEYLKISDLYIGSGGLTIHEMVFHGLLCLIISVASNQIPSSEYLHKNKVVNYLGHYRKVKDDLIRNEIIKTIKNGNKDQFLNLHGFIDGDGFKRVISAMKLK
ncbi:MAG: UDP-2,4-diacetamido-2,4,6-trideoxy-beta-L-altropyranose hydrolase [Candidatus Coatesbacteria bacterium]|nr:UDP-2,4-diacetamido-2,4,6-trideoxy-beta-L-altropyranose hydrolase [Candidatus Coatesbacteria bacterium]